MRFTLSCTSATASLSCSTQSCAFSRNTVPASVKSLPRVERRIKVTPTASSSFFICTLNADCVMFASLAASEKFLTLP